MQIVRKKLSPDNLGGVGQRWDIDTDAVQYTPDGGTTWFDVPTLDPRHADQFRLPANTSDTARCDAAARIVGLWQETLAELFSSVAIAGLATTWLEFLLALTGPVGWFVDLLIAVGESMAIIGVATIEAAFTPDVWHGIECIIYCHCDANGQISASQRDAILADINAAYPGTVYNTLVLLTQMYGEVLMSNAGVERTETGDCDGCGCGTCYGVDWTVDADDVSTHVYAAEWISARGYTWIVSGDSGTANISTLWNDATPCLYTRCEVDVFTYVSGVEYAIYGRTNNDIPDHDQTLFGSGVCDTGLSTIGIDLPGTDSYYGLQIVLTMPGSTSGGMDIHGARIFSPNLSAAGLVSNC